MTDGQPRIEGYGYDVTEIGLGRIPYNDLLGIAWDLLSPDRVEAHLDVRPDHLQPYGIVHGGVYCSLVEAVGSAAGAARAMEHGKLAVGVHNATSFIRTAGKGRLDVVATPVHVGRTQHLWLVEITGEDGRLVARGDLRMQVMDGVERKG